MKIMDINILAKVLVERLSPALPYLLKSGDRVSEGATRQIGIELVQKVWSELGSIVTTNPFTSRAAEKVAEDPFNEDAKASLRQEIRELLSNDKELALELSKIIESSASSVEVDNRSGGFYGTSMTFHGDVAGRDMTKGN